MFSNFGAFLSDLSHAALFETWGAVGVALLLLVATFACGLLAIPERIASPVPRALAGFPLLFLFGGTLGILVYLAGGTVRASMFVLMLCSVVLIAVALWRGVFRELLHWKSLAILGSVLLTGFALAWFGWGETSDGVVRSMSGAWGDGPLHTLNAEAFLLRRGPDLSFPAFAGEKFHEPFGYDFVAAILRAAGFTVGAAFTLPAAGLLACLFGWFGLIAMRCMSQAQKKGRALQSQIIAGFLLVTFGGFQWLAMTQRTGAWTLAEFFGVHNPAWDKAEELGLVWADHLNTFASQKHLLLGVTFLVVLTVMLLDALRTKETSGWFLLFAVVTGILPLFHAHVFLAAGLLWLSALLLSRSRALFLFGVLAALIAAPIIFWQATLFTRAGFISFTPGWMAGGVSNWVFFWLKNLGVFLPLAIVAIVRGYHRDRTGTLLLAQPALALFLLANIIQFQPYQWDNFKVFLVVWLLLLPLVIAEMTQWRFSGAGVLRWSLVLLMSLTTLSEFATHLHFRASYPVYSAEDRIVARRLDAELPRDAVVLARTDAVHNHPLTLTGRTLLAGYGGWLWTRNYAWEERAVLIERLWTTDPGVFCPLALREGITHRVDEEFHVRAVAEDC